MEKNKEIISLKGPKGSMDIDANDNLTKKLAMIIEHKCLGVKATEVAKKYGYSRSRYFQIQGAFEKGGSEALKKKKRGPQRNYVRTETINNQIMRHRFLDPDASAAVIAQKMRQSGYKVSQRSVERTITELGLQKKTPFSKSGKREHRNRALQDKKKDTNNSYEPFG